MDTGVAEPSPARHGVCKNTQPPRRLPSPVTERARDLRSWARSFDFVRVAHFARPSCLGDAARAHNRAADEYFCDRDFVAIIAQWRGGFERGFGRARRGVAIELRPYEHLFRFW